MSSGSHFGGGVVPRTPPSPEAPRARALLLLSSNLLHGRASVWACQGRPRPRSPRGSRRPRLGQAAYLAAFLAWPLAMV